MRAAIVLDKSGTILKACRVVTDIRENKTFFHVNTLKFVVDIGGFLVNVKSTSSAIKKGSRLKFGKVICASSNVLPKISEEILKEEKVSEALKKVTIEAERHCGSEIGTCAALILNREGLPTHAVGLGGRIYGDVREVVEAFRRSDDDVFIATGNCREATLRCAKILGIDRRFVLADASPREKRDFVEMLRGFYGLVVMVGNDINDLLALREADISILVRREEPDGVEAVPSEVDYIISSLRELPKIVYEIKKAEVKIDKN